MKRKNLIFCLSVALVILLLSVWMISDLRHWPSRKLIETNLDPQRPMVALTFDDGPQRPYTEQVLNILYDQQVPATFFLLGKHICDNEPILKDMAACGHELANHSFSHRDFTTLTEIELLFEVSETQSALSVILPNYRMQYIRPPYGHCTPNLEKVSDLPVVLWDIDSGDWEHSNADFIYLRVTSAVKDGDIIIFHDDNEETVKALPKIIQNLKKRGFQFATVSQLNACRPESTNYRIS